MKNRQVIIRIIWNGERSCIPLEKYANPNVHKGAIEVELATFLKIIGQKIKIFKGDKVLDAEVVHLSRPRQLSQEQLWFDYPKLENGRLAPSLVNTLSQKLQTGDVVYLRMVAQSEDLHVQSAVFQIGKPKQKTWTPGWRPSIQKGGEVYGFQIINEEGRQPVLRIDTLNEETKHILSLYQENKQYKIIHIPGFKTRKRLVTERESLFTNKEIQNTVYLDFDFDLFTISDYTDFVGKKVELHWGKLIANPESEDYEVKQLHDQLPKQPILWIGNKQFQVKGFHLIYAGRTQKPVRYIASSINAPELHQALLKLPALTSIYFEHLIIERNGQFFQFPAAFSFHLGESKEYELDVEIAKPDQPVIHSIDSSSGTTTIVFQNTDLKKVILDILNIEEGKLRFSNFGNENPKINISFHSEKLNLNAGKDLVIKRLSSLFKLTIENQVPRPTYNLKVKDETLLSQALSTEPSENESPNREEKTIGFKSVTMETLTRFIDSELDLLIINETQTQDKNFALDLEYKNQETVKKSLNQIGLELERNKEYVQIVVTKLY